MHSPPLHPPNLAAAGFHELWTPYWAVNKKAASLKKLPSREKSQRKAGHLSKIKIPPSMVLICSFHIMWVYALSCKHINKKRLPCWRSSCLMGNFFGWCVISWLVCWQTCFYCTLFVFYSLYFSLYLSLLFPSTYSTQLKCCTSNVCCHVNFEG